MCQHAEVACFFVSGDTEYKQKESPYTQPETKQNKKQTNNNNNKKKKREEGEGGKKKSRNRLLFSLFDKELEWVMRRIKTPRRFPPCLSALFL